MANPQNFFEDPEFLAAMQRSGISHQPGMAAGLMSELAPLLKADGVDLDDPNLALSRQEIDAAIERAVEQHNLELFTPVGRARANVMTYIELIADALYREDADSVLQVLSTINPAAQGDVPAGSHMIGVSLGLIDTWLVGASANQALPVTPVPKWRGQARDIAQDFIVLARQGRAFDSHGRFVMKHAGELVMHGAVLAASAVVIAVARRDDVALTQAFEGLVCASETHGEAPVVYRATDTRTGAAREMAQFLDVGLVAWLDDGSASQAELEDVLDELRLLEMRAVARRLDIHDPADLMAFMGVLDRAGESPEQYFSFVVLDHYTRFRSDESGQRNVWGAIGDMLETRIARYESAEKFQVPGQERLQAIVAESTATPAPGVDAALDAVPIIRGTQELLGWLEKPQPVTGTGGVRRADIARVAQMIGVRAEGVARLPQAAFEDPYMPDRVVYAQSMFQVPTLENWWLALRRAEVITLTASRVKRGAAVSLEGNISRETRLAVCAGFVEEYVCFKLEAGGYAYFIDLTYVVSQMLIACLENGIDLERFALTTNGRLELDDTLPEEVQRLDHSGRRRLLVLERAGLLERSADGRMRVVPALRGAVAQGLDAAIERFKRL